MYYFVRGVEGMTFIENTLHRLYQTHKNVKKRQLVRVSNVVQVQHACSAGARVQHCATYVGDTSQDAAHIILCYSIFSSRLALIMFQKDCFCFIYDDFEVIFLNNLLHMQFICHMMCVHCRNWVLETRPRRPMMPQHHLQSSQLVSAGPPNTTTLPSTKDFIPAKLQTHSKGCT